MNKLFLFALLIHVVLANHCVRETGERHLDNDCYCENQFYQFGDESRAKRLDEKVKIGFIADSGVGDNARSVLRVLKENNVDAIVHSGDLDYRDSSSEMETNINTIFPSDFPYFYTIGNHDVDAWLRYQRRNRDRLQDVSSRDLYCQGNLGVKASCWFKGVQIVSTGAGTLCDNHKEYLEDTLSESNSKWKICSIHKVHKDFQLGSKTSEIGYEIYQACIDGGALIITGHDHVYGRTHIIKDAEDKEIIKQEPHIIKRGQSMIWVNGLGGYSRFSEKNDNQDNSWWDSAFTRTTGSQYGALICTFDTNRADCEFKTIIDTTLDTVTLYNENDDECVPHCPECTKSWTTAIGDGCGNQCPQDNCQADERCSSYAGFRCVTDPRCYIKCLESVCIQPGEAQPTNWCGGICNLPDC